MQQFDLKEARLEAANARMKNMRIGFYLEQAIDEIERLRASQERLKSAVEFAHSEGFEWPSDPMAEFAQPALDK